MPKSAPVFYLIPLAIVMACAAHAATVSAGDISKTITQASSDPAKVKAYCDMSKKMAEIGNDDKKAEAAGDVIDGYFKVLGTDFTAAWDTGQEAKESSPE